MADTKDDDAAPPKKKGGLVKIIMMAVGALLLIGGGVAGGIYAAGRGAKAADDNRPKLVPKSEQKKAAGDTEHPAAGGSSAPSGTGGDKFASNYYALDKDFTSNLQDSVHVIQVGIAVSTPYDDRVIENLKTNEIAVRSSILLALGDTTEEQVFSSAGKRQLQGRLVKAINDTLQQKEGFGGIGNVYFTNFVVQ